MQSNRLIIVFVKNILLGKVKTRLAESIGDYGAFEVYKELVAITESETSRFKDADLYIYFSDVIIESKWEGSEKFVQEGSDLGERMKQAFQKGFEKGYDTIIGIGSDLPDMNVDMLEEAFYSLEDSQTVFGPSADGGYYLLGMNQLHDCIFDNKAWSTVGLLNDTLNELEKENISYSLLTELNDIDTLDDLIESSLSDKFSHLYELSRSNKRSI
jgi:rSAM/selenodomain-associated transferase 1